MRSRVLVGLLLAAPSGDGCGGGEKSGDSQAAKRWAGRFQSTFGSLSLDAKGGQVTGSDAYCGGRLRGTAKGNRLAGDWVEDAGACAPNERRGPGTEDKGSFEFTLSSDGSSFTGKWRYASGKADPRGDEWRGTRIGPSP